MAVADGESVTENEVYACGLLDINLMLVEMFYAVCQLLQLPESQPIFENYFPNWVSYKHWVSLIFEGAGEFLELERQLLVFHIDETQPPGPFWGRVIRGRRNYQDPSKPRKDIYFNPSMWERSPRLLQLEVGTDWKDLIGCETLVFHSILQTLMGIPPPQVRWISNCHLPKYNHMTNQELAEHLGFDPHTFNRSRPCRVAGLRLCQDAASHPNLQNLTLTNADSFLWFCKHVWLITNGMDLVDGKVEESDLVETNPKLQEISDAMPAISDYYYQTELV